MNSTLPTLLSRFTSVSSSSRHWPYPPAHFAYGEVGHALARAERSHTVAAVFGDIDYSRKPDGAVSYTDIEMSGGRRERSGPVAPRAARSPGAASSSTTIGLTGLARLTGLTGLTGLARITGAAGLTGLRGLTRRAGLAGLGCGVLPLARILILARGACSDDNQGRDNHCGDSPRPPPKFLPGVVSRRDVRQDAHAFYFIAARLVMYLLPHSGVLERGGEPRSRPGPRDRSDPPTVAIAA